MIKVLEKNVSDKIAAGEVIERPVSIVKELVENSIDAGSNKITIEIENGGKSYIRVTDNGCGINKDEVRTAFLRHATSKISDVKDLNFINSLGFRGEALASISAVTRLEIITKTADQKVAKRLLINGGEIITDDEVGSIDGTTIITRDLFYNTPARLKFLKQDNVESGKIIQLISEYALCYTDIQFRLINNHNILFSTQGDGNRLNIINRVFSDVNTNNLVEVLYSDNGIKVSGYISNPQMSKTNRKSQIFFVNGRIVDSKVIEKGINLGYKERLFEGRFPICYLFINIDSDKLDVNIHPNKREVRFDNETLVSQTIALAIINSLKTKESIPQINNVFKNISDSLETPEKIEQVDIKTILSTNNKICNSEIIVEKQEEKIELCFDEIIYLEKPNLKPFDFDDLNIKGILFNTYIEAYDSNSFYLIDQHAAQERILYEKLVSEYDSETKNRQPIIIPIIINVSLSSNEDKYNWLSKLDKMGFTINEFGNGSFRVTEIPMFMELNEAEDFINSFIDNIDSSIDLRNKVIVNKLIMMSCKASIKANDKITLDEAIALINDLKICVNPYSCPHGRPTVIKFTKYEIERMFKRV